MGGEGTFGFVAFLAVMTRLLPATEADSRWTEPVVRPFSLYPSRETKALLKVYKQREAAGRLLWDGLRS